MSPHTRRHSSFRHRIAIEPLESRQMMAGDVRAVFQNGNLVITEEPGSVGQANGVQITQLDNGRIRVAGNLTAEGGDATSKVNGQESQDFKVTGGLFVKLGGGDDRVQLGLDNATAAPFFKFINIDVAQPTSVSRRGTRTPAAGSLLPLPAADRDEVFVWAANTTGSLSINVGRGGSHVFVGKATIGDGVGGDSLTFRSGAGRDGFVIQGATVHGNVDVQTYGSLAETDTDVVGIDAHDDGINPIARTKIDGNLAVRTGGGDDGFFVSNRLIPHSSLFVALETLGSAIIDTGAGDDRIEMFDAKIGAATGTNDRDLLIRTGTGADVARLSNVKVAEYFDLRLHEGTESDADTAALDHVFVSRDAYILTGGGADAISLDDSTVYGNLLVDAGAGDDHVDLFDYVISLGTASLSGGLDTDVLSFHRGNAFDHLTLHDWEFVLGLPTDRLPNDLLLPRRR